MLKRKIELPYYALLFSFINLVLYHLPFFRFVGNNFDVYSLSGLLLLFSLVITALFVNALFFYLLLFLFRGFGKILMALFFIINAVSVYFVATYGVIIDESMIGNVLNTNTEESASFFSLKLVLYIIFLGILPSIFLFITKYIRVSLKKFFVQISVLLSFLLILIFANSANWLWIDKNSKSLGGLAMPWSYAVNLNLYYLHKSQQNKEQIILPNATLTNNEKSVVVLVIGESARSANFSLYGYGKNTNPLLSKIPNIHAYKAQSSATYTTAGVKSILDYKETNDLYEILPNYLYRNDVEVIWRTTNSGEPPIKIKDYQSKEFLEEKYKGKNSAYDEILLSGLKEQISESKKNKILVVLHTSTSHGPTYNSKYPANFEVFSPVCKSVELANCSQQELINAYDNTIVYTDFILATLIADLQDLPQYKSCMLYVSDHGESLGENNLYMHGIPVSLAPKEQLDIPFIVWVSTHSKNLKQNSQLSQYNVFHSVLDFLAIKSPIYDETKSIFAK